MTGTAFIKPKLCTFLDIFWWYRCLMVLLVVASLKKSRLRLSFFTWKKGCLLDNCWNLSTWWSWCYKSYHSCCGTCKNPEKFHDTPLFICLMFVWEVNQGKLFCSFFCMNWKSFAGRWQIVLVLFPWPFPKISENANIEFFHRVLLHLKVFFWSLTLSFFWKKLNSKKKNVIYQIFAR